MTRTLEGRQHQAKTGSTAHYRNEQMFAAFHKFKKDPHPCPIIVVVVLCIDFQTFEKLSSLQLFIAQAMWLSICPACS